MWASPPTNIHETFFHTIVLRKKSIMTRGCRENKKTRPEYSQDGATRAIFI